MPVLTRSKRRLLSGEGSISTTVPCTITLIDITNKKPNKLTNTSQKQNSSEHMSIIQQNTVEIPVTVAGKKRRASQSGVSVETQHETTEAAKKSRSEISQKNEDSGSSSSQHTANSSTDEHSKFIEMMRNIKKMHEESFKNVAERLQLDPVPSCLYDLKKCRDNHFAKNPVKTISHTLQTTLLDALSVDARIWRFTHSVRHNVLGLNLFPGHVVLSEMLVRILKLNSSQEFNINFVLGELHSLFADIVDKFPPCHIRHQYLKVLCSKFTFEEKQENKHLLPTILDHLNDLIFHRNASSAQVRKFDNDMVLNFDMWDQCQENKSFANFSTDDKFERLFLVLDLTVRVLEHDASIFIIKNSYKFASSISNDQRKPLICSVIWQDHESVIVLNSLIKQIISIFVAMVALQYPADKIKILSRLLSLVSHVINMYEYPNDTFQYPTYKNYSIDFAREIQQRIEKSSYYCLYLHQRVVEHIRSPLVRMLLMNFMVSKVFGTNKAISLSIPFNAILNKEMDKYAELPRDKLHKSTERYPKCDDLKNYKKYTIVQEDFLQMLLNYTEAVDSYYCISTAAASCLGNPTTQRPANESSIIVNQDDPLASEVILRKIDLNFKKMVHIRFTKETCTFYHDEIKHFLLLKKYVNNWHKKSGPKFDGWMEFIQNADAKMTMK